MRTRGVTYNMEPCTGSLTKQSDQKSKATLIFNQGFHNITRIMRYSTLSRKQYNSGANLRNSPAKQVGNSIVCPGVMALAGNWVWGNSSSA